MLPKSLKILGWVAAIVVAAAWLFRGLLQPGYPILLDHPIHYAETLYLLEHLIPKTGWVSGWCDLNLAGFPMLITYCLFGYLPAVLLHLCLGMGPEAAYKCAVFLAYLFAALMLFVFLKRSSSTGAAGIIALVWLSSPLALSPCAYGLWQQYWGIGFLLGVCMLCGTGIQERSGDGWSRLRKTMRLAILFFLIAFSHVFSALALSIFIVLWLMVSRGRTYPGSFSVTMAGTTTLLVGACYFGPFWESLNWLAAPPASDFVSLPALASKVLGSLWKGSPVLFLLALFGLWPAKSAMHRTMFLFLLICLVCSLAPWRYIPGLSQNNFLANLHVHGDRALLYAQIPAAFFAARGLDRIWTYSGWRRLALSVPFALAMLWHFSGVIRQPNMFLTSSSLEEAPFLATVRDWVQNRSPDHRGLVQSTVGNVPGMLGQSHVLVLLSFQTKKPQVGGWIGGTLYPHERQFLTESGMLFGRQIGQVSNLELLRRFQLYDLTWVLTCEPRLQTKLEATGFFQKEITAGPFAVYTLKAMFYNPAPWKADPPAAFINQIPSESGQILLSITTDRDQTKLVLKHTAHPFWRARLDGRPVALGQDSNGQITCDIPRNGSHNLQLRFVHPKPLWLGISGVTAALMAMAWIVSALRIKDTAHAI